MIDRLLSQALKCDGDSALSPPPRSEDVLLAQLRAVRSQVTINGIGSLLLPELLPMLETSRSVERHYRAALIALGDCLTAPAHVALGDDLFIPLLRANRNVAEYSMASCRAEQACRGGDIAGLLDALDTMVALERVAPVVVLELNECAFRLDAIRQRVTTTANRAQPALPPHGGQD